MARAYRTMVAAMTYATMHATSGPLPCVHCVLAYEWSTTVQVPQWNVANDVVEDFDAGLEYGEAERILKSVQRGDTREYLVQ